MEAIISQEQLELLAEIARRLEKLEAKIDELELQIQSLRSEA
jgi:chaperonin cofactor prefoldin